MSDVRGKEGGGGRFEPWWGDKVVYLGKLLLSTHLSPTRSINEYKQIVRGGVTKFLVVTCNWLVYYPERIIWTLVFWNPLPILVTFAFTRFAVSLSLRFWNLPHPFLSLIFYSSTILCITCPSSLLSYQLLPYSYPLPCPPDLTPVFPQPSSLLPQSVPTQLMLINLCFQLIRLEWMLWLFTWQVGAASGLLKRLIIEPFVPHKQVDPVTHTSFVMLSILVFLFTLCFRRSDKLWPDRSLGLSMDF